MSGPIARRAILAVSGWLLLTGLFCTIGPAIAQQMNTGADEYRISCASCHGAAGSGDGSLAAILTVRPGDLTTLSKRNGGEFPENRVYSMIDGREGFYAHGERDMPVWGIRYLLAHAIRYGDSGAEQVVQARIARLVEFLQSIQQ